MATRSQAERTAVRKALTFVQGLKKDVDLRKVRDKAVIVAKDQYEAAEYIGRLAIAGKAQKILNRVSTAIRDDRVDANDLDRKKLKEIAGEALKDYKANLLMRNMLSSAYNAGYREQGLADRTKAFWLYLTMKDSQVRPSHQRWEGLLLPKDSELATRIFPPNGHNCRCRMKAVSRKTADELLAKGEATKKVPKLITQRYVDKATGKTKRTLEGVDPGWEGAPNDKAEAIAKLLEEQIAMLDSWNGD